MSQDLFAAFGDFESNSAPVLVKQDDVGPSLNGSLQTFRPSQNSDLEDDDFGDFEEAAAPSLQNPQSATRDAHKVDAVRGSSAKVDKRSDAPVAVKQQTGRIPYKPKVVTQGPQKSAVGRHPFADHMDVLFAADDDEYDAGQDEWNDLSNNPEAAMAYSKRVIQEQLDAEARAASLSSAKPSTARRETMPSAPAEFKAKDLNVLFDAEDLSDHADDDDDFGEFEEVAEHVQERQAVQSDLGTTTTLMDLLGLDDDASAANKGTLHVPHRTQANVVAVTSSMSPVEDDPWDDFDIIAQQPATTAISTTVHVAAVTLPLPTISPTNIPPPSMIISLLGTRLKAEVTLDTIPGLLHSAWVLAHVFAGRKLRWKRSSTLAASMRIGPAAAGGKSGMKLAGVDRTEVAKEEREVAEALSIWRARVGKMRTAVASYKMALASDIVRVRKVPEINESMPIKLLNPSEGGFSASHECALCGLRRDERVLKVDEIVEDSFGEWWIENANMHTVCAEWWVTNEAGLRLG